MSDHLEVLYDLDVEARILATALGLAFARTRMPNDDPRLSATLADVVRRSKGRLQIMLLAGCATDRASSSATDCVPVTAGIGEAQHRVTVSARDDRFDPACINALEEGAITLAVRNDGRHPHNLTLENGDSVSVDSAQVAFLTARVGREGLSYVCTIHPGMRGHINVRP